MTSLLQLEQQLKSKQAKDREIQRKVDSGYYLAIAENQEATLEELQELVDALRRKLTIVSYRPVIAALASNPNTPVAFLKLLMEEDFEVEVRENPAFDILCIEYPDLAHTRSKKQLVHEKYAIAEEALSKGFNYNKESCFWEYLMIDPESGLKYLVKAGYYKSFGKDRPFQEIHAYLNPVQNRGRWNECYTDTEEMEDIFAECYCVIG